VAAIPAPISMADHAKQHQLNWAAAAPGKLCRLHLLTLDVDKETGRQRHNHCNVQMGETL